MDTHEILTRAVEYEFLPKTLQPNVLMVVFIDPDGCVVTCPIHYALVDDDSAFELLIKTMRSDRNKIRKEHYGHA